MTRKGKTLVKGHALVREGAAFEDDGSHTLYGGTGGVGRAKCSCGVMSPRLGSGRARRAWHAEHKEVYRGND